MTTSIQCHDLICCIPDGCGGRNYFCANTIALTELRDGRLIDTGHRAEGTGNQMQLVLDNKFRRLFVVRNTKQCRRFVIKRDLSKFIYSCYNKSRQMLVNSIVNNMNRETARRRMEMTMLIRAFDCHSVLNKINIIMLCIELFTAPGTNLDLHRV